MITKLVVHTIDQGPMPFHDCPGEGAPKVEIVGSWFRMFWNIEGTIAPRKESFIPGNSVTHINIERTI